MGDLKINGVTPSDVYYGGTAASAVYYGSVKVWEPAPTTAVIGNKTYPTVRLPDGHVWLAVNLDYAWTGLSVPTSGASSVTTPQAMYYNYDEATYGWSGSQRGLLYNYYAVEYLQTNRATLCPGWHVPTRDEFEAVCTGIGDWTHGDKLKSTSGWKNNGNGTDDYGFAAYPSGVYSGGFAYATAQVNFWTQTTYNTTTSYNFYLVYNSTNFYSYYSANTAQYSVRLIKDY